ncbi:MAG: hypothetical protein HYX81_02565 [Chloroflexi bacterium]|nr:hypothetical protein [Chloroflexota bacterium]
MPLISDKIHRMNDFRMWSTSFCLILVLSLVLSGCKNTRPIEQQPLFSPRVALIGTGLSPRSTQPDDFTGFFAKAKQMGDVVMWAGDWLELNNTTGGGPAVVAGLAATYGYVPLIEGQFFTQSTGTLLRPLDDETRQVYQNSAVAFARKYALKYLGLGIEINILYERSPADFEAFSQFFSEVYDAVKEASPDTKVFTVFQLEKMKGLNGGLFGGSNDPDKAQWALLDKFSKSDIIAFTTYPGLIYKDPAEIPDDYYTDISRHTAKPVAFTEIGWHSEASPPGWESSGDEQARFVSKFFSLTQDFHRELTIWSFMYDQATIEPFRSMGLYNKDGTPKPAWNEWLYQKSR